MTAREEKRAAFNEQMNDWVSRQGIWFQLRHAADAQTITARLMRIALRFSLLAVIALCCVWFYLSKRVEGEGFRQNMQSDLAGFFHAQTCELGKLTKTRDTLDISSLKIEGGERSFFHHLSASGMQLHMDLIDGVLTDWETDLLSVNQLEIEVKGGDSTDEAAATSFAALFAQSESFSCGRIIVDEVTVRWGYSEMNRGSITGSRMSVVREGDAWNLEFAGGHFSQNWLRWLEIDRISATIDVDGVHVREAILKSGMGTLRFNAKLGSGGKPEVNGQLELASMPVSALLPESYTEWLDGSISGEGVISGSTNSQEGIVLDLNLQLRDGDVLVMRDRLPLLSALSVVDLYNSYRKISFTEGGLRVRTGGSQLDIRDVDMQSGMLLHVKTDGIVVREPNSDEVAKDIGIENAEIVQQVLENQWNFEDDDLVASDVQGVGLKDAIKEVKEIKVFAPKELSDSEKVLISSILRESKVRRFDGAMRLGLKSDAFDKALKLKSAYPVDTETNKIWIDVPLSGRIESLTLEQAKTFYELGKNRL